MLAIPLLKQYCHTKWSTIFKLYCDVQKFTISQTSPYMQYILVPSIRTIILSQVPLFNFYQISYSSNLQLFQLIIQMNRSLRTQTPQRHPASRVPLYPLGTSINYQPYQPINSFYEVPKKFSSFGNVALPSYQQRLIERQSQIRAKVPREELERQLIAQNEAAVQNQNRRRRQLQESFLRQIQRLQIILTKNSERKEKLRSQIQLLQQDKKVLLGKVEDEKDKIAKYQAPQGLQRKQGEIIELKDQMVSQIRAKEQDLLRQKQQQQAVWEQKLKQKQNSLISAQEKRSAARNQLLRIRREAQTECKVVVASSVSDIARGRKYQQFKYDFDVLKQKVATLNNQRIASARQLDQNKHTKSIVVRDQAFKIQELRKIKTGIQENIKEIQLRNKQLEKTNQNIQEQHLRKQELIVRYQSDIQEARIKASENDAQINAKLNQFRGRETPKVLQSLSGQIQEVQRRIRQVQADTFRLRGDFKKIGQYLQSQVTKSVYQTFNDIKAS